MKSNQLFYFSKSIEYVAATPTSAFIGWNKENENAGTIPRILSSPSTIVVGKIKRREIGGTLLSFQRQIYPCKSWKEWRDTIEIVMISREPPFFIHRLINPWYTRILFLSLFLFLSLS